jgi:hypothetical protein
MPTMAQDLSIDVPISSAAPTLASEAPAPLSVTAGALSQTVAPQFLIHNDHTSQDMNALDAEPKVIEDDDVQFVFSAPRRRKRKRKRYEAWKSAELLLIVVAELNSRTLHPCSINAPFLQSTLYQSWVAWAHWILFGGVVWEFCNN